MLSNSVRIRNDLEAVLGVLNVVFIASFSDTPYVYSNTVVLLEADMLELYLKTLYIFSIYK